MKILLFIVMLLLSFTSYSQDDLDSWIENLRLDIITNQDMKKYCNEVIPDDVIINFVFVDDLNVVYLDDSIIKISMIGYGGNVNGCLFFSYKKIKDVYFLNFSEIKEIKNDGGVVKVISPWYSKSKKCDE